MVSLDFRSIGRVIVTALSMLILINTTPITLANPLVHNVSSTTLTKNLSSSLYSIQVTDNFGQVHEMIISTVSIGT